MTALEIHKYETARQTAFEFVSGYLLDMTAYADHLVDLLGKGHGQLGLVEEAYTERLGYRALNAGSTIGHGLAFLEDRVHLLDKMKVAFTRAADELRQVRDPDKTQELDKLEREMEVYQPFYERDVLALFDDFSAEISREWHSDTYLRDRAVIADVWADMEKAMKTASWEPEFVDVTPQSGGIRMPLEAPSSAKLGEIAKMAAQLLRLGLGT